MTNSAGDSSSQVARQIPHPGESLPEVLSRLFDELPVGLILYDARADFRVSYANPVMEEWTAPENRPLVGRTLGEVLPGMDIAAITGALTEVARSGISRNWRNFRFSRRGHDSLEQATYWDWNAIPLRDAAGVTSHVMGVAINESSQELVRERLQVSLDLALDLTSSLDPDAVVDRLLGRALSAVRADRASLLRVEGDEAVAVGAVDLHGPAPARGTRWPITVPQFQQLLRDRKPLVERFNVEDLPNEELKAQLASVRHSVTIPLVVEGSVFGALSVSRREGEAFSTADMLTIQQIGSVSVLAVRNALLFAETQAAHHAAERTAQRLRIGVELALDLAEQPGPGAVIRQALRRAVDTLEADRATLVTVLGDDIVIEDCVAVGTAEPLPVGSRWPISGQPLVAEAIRARSPIRGRHDNPGLPAQRDDLWDNEHVVMVPLVLQGDVTALLAASRLAEPPLTQEEIATLQQVGSVAVLALRNARLLEEAQAASRAKSDFLNLAAHELRTPLSVISGYLSMLQDGSFGEPSEMWRAPIDTVAHKASELSGLVRSLLTAARIQAGTLPSNRGLVDLRQLVKEACLRAEARAHLLGGEVILETPDAAVRVLADEDHVGRVLDNLLNNALTYSDGPAVVEVVVSLGATAEVQVTDHGIGIDPAQHARVFERFYRADPAVTMHSGTGLGLYIARELAGQNGGSLELLTSAPGSGSSFVLRLPLAEPLSDDAKPSSAPGSDPALPIL